MAGSGKNPTTRLRCQNNKVNTRARIGMSHKVASAVTSTSIDPTVTEVPPVTVQTTLSSIENNRTARRRICERKVNLVGSHDRHVVAGNRTNPVAISYSQHDSVY